MVSVYYLKHKMRSHHMIKNNTTKTENSEHFNSQQGSLTENSEHFNSQQGSLTVGDCFFQLTILN